MNDEGIGHKLGSFVVKEEFEHRNRILDRYIQRLYIGTYDIHRYDRYMQR